MEVGRYVRWHLNRRPTQIVGDPERKTRDFVHVSDVVWAFLLMADRGDPGEVLNVGSAEEVSMRQLAELIGGATGREPAVDKVTGIDDDTYRLVADISKINTLGYAPRVLPAEE